MFGVDLFYSLTKGLTALLLVLTALAASLKDTPAADHDTKQQLHE